ncbi:MAG: chemotaxis response regulator protein-glutamate methylesterase [Spirochaetales bacterium]|nr:chemotaxis response regulator protein-glutamate methylesterase [Spirochaetales bacterium]
MDPIRVLIIDDSSLMRKLIRTIFEKTDDIEVAATALNGIFGLHKMDSRNPDVIILDLEMPEMNGLDFLKEKKKRGNNTPVIILSSVAQKGAAITMQALASGASDFLLKPSTGEASDISRISSQLIDLVRIYGLKEKEKKKSIPREEDAVYTKAYIPKKPQQIIKKKVPKRNTETIEIIAIGISTGGPNALRSVFSRIRSDMPVPIIVVQHMPKGFTEEFANSLNKICPLDVKEAVEGDIIRPGRILIAPGDRHIQVKARPLANIVSLNDGPPQNGHRPSAGVLFTSVAETYQNRSMAFIMTGMGKDGAIEIGMIYEEGGITIAQDEKSCVVFGMPKVAIEQGNIHKVIALEEIAEFINTINN